MTSGSNAIRSWRCGEFPIPDWVMRNLMGGIESNGTFALKTPLGPVRVHPESTVIEHGGNLQVLSSADAADFLVNLELAGTPTGKRRRNERKRVDQLSIYPPPLGPQPSIEWIHLERLSIDSTYQRSTDNDASRRLIANIAARFDWRLCAPLVVSRRSDDTLNIIDGQHRWQAACKRIDIPQLPCCVFRYANIQEEARMFLLANRTRKPINRLDDYFAALAAADEDAMEIQKLVTDAGLTVARNTATWQPGEVVFTAAIANAIRKFGAPIASAALTDIAVAFPNQKLTQGAAIFAALVRILSQRGPDFDPDRLMAALQARTADEWGAFGAGLRTGELRTTALREAIMRAYEQIQPAAE